ncbi:MAG: TetR/AcrR family transcriptional regulator [Desulfobacteraceae bacterium]|nr:TetR/AcrR family transcriptional regulator [Desulfobacteraceae bacterium]
MGQKERRQREKMQRRTQILNAARALLLKEGFSRTSVNKISKKAELSIGSIYFYFTNKAEIFASLQQEGLEILHTYLVSETEGVADPRVQLQKGAEAYYQFSRAHKDYFDVINYFLSSPQVFFSEDVNRTIGSKGLLILEQIAGIIRQGNDQKVFDEPCPNNFAVFFWSSLHGLVQIRKLQGIIIESDDYFQFFQYSVDKLIESIKFREVTDDNE